MKRSGKFTGSFFAFTLKSARKYNNLLRLGNSIRLPVRKNMFCEF
jgi:hypothetical protein